MSGWPLIRDRGPASVLHERTVPEAPERAVWLLDVDRPAVVLGSTQSDDVVDGPAAAVAGIDVVRRRSGGGAVLLAPGEVTWLDVVLPAGDPLWVDDVGRSAVWLGRCWAGALHRLGIEAQAYEGPMVRSEWSTWACFGGLAPGEVTVEGRKVLGISQRRTRRGARFQTALVHTWRPEALVALLKIDPGRRVEALEALTASAGGVGPMEADVVVRALVAALAASDPT